MKTISISILITAVFAFISCTHSGDNHSDCTGHDHARGIVTVADTDHKQEKFIVETDEEEVIHSEATGNKSISDRCDHSGHSH